MLFRSGKTNRKDFEGFKESLNHLSDQELAERMEAFWDENTVYPSMEVGRKREIHRRLRLQIHPPKISIRWSRIVVAAAVIAVLSVTAWNFSLLHELQNANSSFLAEVPAGDKVQLTLPDKSSVKLNSESSLSYAYVNEMTADLVESTMGPVRQALSDSGLSANDLQKVLKIGRAHV